MTIVRARSTACRSPVRSFAVLLLVGLLGACGSDDNPVMSPGGDPGAGQAFPPASATASNDGLIQFILQLANSNNETDTPSELTGEVLPADEESAPMEI